MKLVASLSGRQANQFPQKFANKKHYETGYPPEADQPRAGKPVPAGKINF